MLCSKIVMFYITGHTILELKIMHYCNANFYQNGIENNVIT